jgi:hypothetical protein
MIVVGRRNRQGASIPTWNRALASAITLLESRGPRRTVGAIEPCHLRVLSHSEGVLGVSRRGHEDRQ